MIDLISYRCLPWCNHMDHFFVSYHFIYLMAQSVPHWWGILFTQQTLCLPHVFLIHSSWYIGIYIVDTLLYSLCFTNYNIPFLPLLSIHPQVFTWVLQPKLLLKIVTIPLLFWTPGNNSVLLKYATTHAKRVQKGIAYWDKQNNDVPASNCVLKVWREIIKVEDF